MLVDAKNSRNSLPLVFRVVSLLILKESEGSLILSWAKSSFSSTRSWLRFLVLALKSPARNIFPKELFATKSMSESKVDGSSLPAAFRLALYDDCSAESYTLIIVSESLSVDELALDLIA